MDWGLILGAVGVAVVPVTVGIGVLMGSPGPRELVFAKLCFAATAFSLLVSFILLASDEPLGPTKLISAGIIGALVSIGLVALFDWAKTKEKPLLKQSNKISLLVECVAAKFPAQVPAEGHIQILSPLRWAEPLISFGERSGMPGEIWVWPDEWQQNWYTALRRCEVTNYGSEPIFNVELPVSVAFMKIERNEESPGSFSASNFVGKAESAVNITKIDSGAANKYVFYVENQSQDVLHISFGKNPTYSKSGEDLRFEAVLVQPKTWRDHIMLWSVHNNEDIVKSAETIKK